MRVSLLLPELKVFTRAVSALGKLGDDLYFECGAGELSLRCVNSSRSAYAAAFFSTNFFEKASGLEDRDDTPRFKLTAKTCCRVFKPSVSWDKVVRKCRLQLDESGNTLIVQFFQRHGLVKTYNLPTIDCESLEAVYNIADAFNHLAASSKVFAEIISNFRPTQTEVTLVIQDGECVFRNFIDDSDFSAIVTHVPVSSSEFETYDFHEETEITFCQKDLRAAISFGETVGSPLVVHSGRPGKPLILTFTDDNRFSAHFVLATLPLTTGSRKRLETSTFSTNITTSISAEESAHLPTCLTKAAPPTSTLPPTNQPDHERTLVHTQTADTQILPVSPHQTPETRLLSARQGDKPLAVRSNNSYEPVPKKARSVLFSRLDNTFFENAPPAQAPELLNAFDSTDEAETEDVPMAERDDITMKRQPLTNMVTPNRAALSGWGDRTVPGRKQPSNVTLLVADSDEEEEEG
ncbi:Cell cycle checkpoint control protein rad9b [Sparganum proliferum]